VYILSACIEIVNRLPFISLTVAVTVLPVFPASFVCEGMTAQAETAIIKAVTSVRSKSVFELFIVIIPRF
jgi:hypothetical protein